MKHVSTREAAEILGCAYLDARGALRAAGLGHTIINRGKFATHGWREADVLRLRDALCAVKENPDV